jgi:hypothetical protein
MNQSTRIVWLLVAAAVGATYAQGRGSEPNPDPLPIVESVGCLSQMEADWILANATDPTVTTTSFTTPEALKAAAEKPLGTQQYRLIGTSPFSPERHKGHKMAVRGILIKGGSYSRINVTSLQMLAETCAKCDASTESLVPLVMRVRQGGRASHSTSPFLRQTFVDALSAAWRSRRDFARAPLPYAWWPCS